MKTIFLTLLATFSLLASAHAAEPRPKAAARLFGGWVPKGCTVEQRGQAMIITGQSRNPSLSKNGLKLSGPVTVRLSTRGPGGPGRLLWSTLKQETFPAEV